MEDNRERVKSDAKTFLHLEIILYTVNIFSPGILTVSNILQDEIG